MILHQSINHIAPIGCKYFGDFRAITRIALMVDDNLNETTLPKLKQKQNEELCKKRNSFN